MSAFLRPALATLVSTLAFLVVIDLGFHVVRTVPVIRDAVPASIVRYLGYGVSVPGKLERAARSDRSLPDEGWLGPDAWAATLAGVTRTPGRHPTRGPGGAGKPCMTLYGMSFSNRLAAVIERQHPDAFDVRRVSAPAAPPNWTLAAYLADRPVSDCRDVVVWTILSTEVAALGSTTMLMHGFDAPQVYSLPAMTARADEIEVRWPQVDTDAALQRAVRDPDVMSEWAASLKAEAAFVPAAWGARWADRSTLLSFVRRGLAVGAIADAKTARTGSPEALTTSGTAETLSLMADRFVTAARADGSRPIILVLQNRGEHAGIAGALCEADPTLPVFDSGMIVNPDDAAQFEPDGHYQKAVDEHVANALVQALRGEIGCDATVADAS